VTGNPGVAIVVVVAGGGVKDEGTCEGQALARRAS
jgi:hypothetical protein